MKKSDSRNKYLFKNTIVFGISVFATKLITFFLVPLYTNELTPEEYGIVDLLFTICSFLFPLFTLNVSEAIYRFSMDKDNNQNKISSIGTVCCILSIILGLITIPIFNAIPTYKDYSMYFYGYLITLSLSQILLISLKGQEKLKLFSIGNVINTFFIAIFNILFLVLFKLGIEGYFLGYIISNIIVIIYGMICNKVHKIFMNFAFDKCLFTKMIKYSLVLLPTSFMWWIINSSDRIMVTAIVGSYDNGIYAISYKIPSLLTVIASIFNQAWVFSAIKEKDCEDNEKFTNQIYERFFVIICISGLFILTFIKPLFSFYIAEEYFEAWKYVPFLVMGFVFTTLATFISTSYNVHKDSKGFLFSGLIGAIANIILNFVFIPFLGVYGAAVATMLSYVVVFVYRIIDTKKYVKIHFTKSQFIMILLMVASSIFTYLDNVYGFIIQLIILVISVFIFYKEIVTTIKSFLKR